MSAVRPILDKLAQLTPEDRRWVLDQLPSAQKERLLESSKASVPPRVPTESTPSAVAAIERASAPTMRALLADEPIWFAAALIDSADWPWRDAYFDLLTAIDRRELQETMSQAKPLTSAMKEALLEAIAERLKTVAPVPAEKLSRFESLLQSLAAKRSRRRWSGAA
ncbi:MAG TPA: hypothetical protein VFS47_02050 [Steroidobacteraceae bacterium]|nr:hypothetical protein [Steroidobacteraceae bacterium]